MTSRASRLIVTLALTLVAALVVGVVSWFAAAAPGYASAAVQNDQRAAWVTSSKDLMVGLLNRQVDEVQSPAYLESPETELLQDGTTVAVVDRKQHHLRTLNTTDVVLAGKLTLPQDADVALSATTVGVADRATGKLWSLPAEGLDGGDLTTTDPAGTAGPGAVVTVVGDAVVAAVPGADALTTVTGSGDGATGATSTPIAGGPLSAADPSATPDPDAQPGSVAAGPIAITAVGTQPVVLDRPAHRLVVADRSFTLPAETTGAVLQQPGPASTDVLLSTDSALLAVNLYTGVVRSEPAPHPGTPAAPVRAAECAHGAWGGDQPGYLAWCGTSPVSRPITGVQTDSALMFRVNGATVVLNDTVTGNTWVLDEAMTLVNNWDEIRSQDSDLDDSDAGTQGSADRLTTARQDCTEQVVPPSPVADEYGVRPGRPRVLGVLDNDDSSSCSISVVTKVDAPDIEGLQAAVVEGGKAVQVTLPTGGTAPITLTYTVSDGLGNDASAKITVTPVTADRPQKPEKVRDSATAMTVGGTITHEVLSDWTSPSGDELFLVAARSSVADDRISYSPDGNITVVDTGTTGATKKAVTFSLSDGENTVQGTLTIEVVDEEKAQPVAGPVFGSGAVDRQIRLDALDAVLWPGSEDLTLTEVAAKKGTSGLTVTPDLQDGTVTVSAARAGSYYLDYSVAAGDKEAQGVMRVDVRDAPEKQQPPIAMTDVAYLPSGGETLLDLTRNDVDPAGGIVAVQQITVPEDSGLVIQGADMHLAKVSARRALSARGVWVPYTVSAGGASARGWIHVIEVPRPSEPMSPTASPISVTVRAGDAVTIPIAEHAVDPGGDLVRPTPFPDDAIDADQGLLFVTDDAIRYMAPLTGALAEGRTLRTQYSVTTTAGKKASANLAVTVVPRGDNEAPLPPSVAQARVFTGGTVDIPLPLDGIDPDGDWAIAAAVDEPPEAGSAAVSGTSAIRYTAFGEPGPDTFTYTATDPFGGTVTGIVDVQVVPLPDTADPPVAPDLTVTVAPNKAIAVNVLDEVSDPAGQAVSFPEQNALQLPNTRSGIEATVRDSTVVVRAGPAEVTVPVQYTVQNTQQRAGSGTLTVTVDENAPAVPPGARDVLVTDTMVDDTRTAAVVDVSASVSNPGGLPEDLRVAVPDVSDGRLSVASADRRTFRVRITDERQVLAYRVVNAENLTAEAFLIVPSRTELNLAAPPNEGPQPPPEPEPPPEEPEKPEEPTKAAEPKKPVEPKKVEVFTPKTLRALEVDAGTEVTVPLGEYVGGMKAGRTLTLAPDREVEATTGTLVRVDATTVRWTVPEDAAGAAQLNLVVSDGVAKPARAGIRATIRPKKPDPPVFQGADIQLEPGQTADPIPLLPLVTYSPDEKKNLTFSDPTGGGDGLTATVTDGALVVSAAETTPKGTTGSYRMTVEDGVNPAVTATFPVTVIGSTKPLASVADRSVEAQAGQRLQVNLLDGASNPFDQPLTVVSVEPGDGYDVSFEPGGVAAVTPAADFSGKLAIGFVVADASGDAERQVNGTLTVTVRGKPDAPGVPSKLEVGNGTAVVQWSVPDDNGSPITGYTVTGTGGFSQECPASPCRLENLTNNVAYSFAVVATNAIGASGASRPSATIRPDTAPEPPPAPEVTFGDGQVEVAWKPPTNNGSPISNYELQLAPGGKATRVGIKVLDRVFDGLENGTEYSVKVRALNASGTPGEWSAADSAVPAGVPAVPAGVTVSAAQDAGAAKKIDIGWKAADPNGDAPTYRVRWSSDAGGGGTIEVPAGTTSASIPDAELGVTYRARVTSVNKAGASEPSERVEVSPYTPPGQVTDLSAAPTGEGGVVELNWKAPADNGRPITGYQYTAGGDNWQPATGTETGFRPPELANGKEYTFRVRACSETDEGTTCGDPSEAKKASPYQPPSAPTLAAVDPVPAPAQLVLTWTAPADNGGRPIAGYRVAPAGTEDWTDVGNVLTWTATGLTNGQRYDYIVQAYTAEKTAQNSPASAPNGETPYDVPSPPQGLTATGGQNTVTLAWTPPASDGGRPVDGFLFDVDGSGQFAAVPAGGVVPQGDWGPHRYRVVAHNPRNSSAPSNEVQTQSFGPVGQVKNLKKEASNQESVLFTWNPPDNNGVNGWQYIVNEQQQPQNQIRVPQGCGKDVTITVAAVDGQGHRGPDAPPVTGRTDDCPPPPPDPTVTMKHGNTRPCETGGGTCYFLAFDFSEIPAGDYTVCFHFDNAGAGCWRDYTGQQISGNGSWSTQQKVGQNGGHYGQNQNTKGWVRISNGSNTFQSLDFNW